MMAGGIRVYADTSVYGGAFDEEFEVPTGRFFSQVRIGLFHLVVSPVVAEEIADAPSDARELFREMSALAETVTQPDEAVRLQDAYLKAGIIGARRMADALHVALATVSGCRAIVSWNFKHIVHFEKIPLYNGVNMANGYAPLGIHTPQEVIERETEEEV